MSKEYYNTPHKLAVRSGVKFGDKHTQWMYDILKRLCEYWQEPDTPLPHIDLFDEISRAVDFEEEVKNATSTRGR